MADSQERNSTAGNLQRHPSRLQKRAPASIQVSPASGFVSDWKVAIPLLSPLILSPASPPKSTDQTEKESSSSSSPSPGEESRHELQIENPSFNTWQHPAAPFHYESAQLLPSFSFVPKCR